MLRWLWIEYSGRRRVAETIFNSSLEDAEHIVEQWRGLNYGLVWLDAGLKYTLCATPNDMKYSPRCIT